MWPYVLLTDGICICFISCHSVYLFGPPTGVDNSSSSAVVKQRTELQGLIKWDNRGLLFPFYSKQLCIVCVFVAGEYSAICIMPNRLSESWHCVNAFPFVCCMLICHQILFWFTVKWVCLTTAHGFSLICYKTSVLSIWLAWVLICIVFVLKW